MENTMKDDNINERMVNAPFTMYEPVDTSNWTEEDFDIAIQKRTETLELIRQMRKTVQGIK